MSKNKNREHSTKLTGQCVKCGEYPYDKPAATGEGNAPRDCPICGRETRIDGERIEFCVSCGLDIDNTDDFKAMYFEDLSSIEKS